MATIQEKSTIGIVYKIQIWVAVCTFILVKILKDKNGMNVLLNELKNNTAGNNEAFVRHAMPRMKAVLKGTFGRNFGGGLHIYYGIFERFSIVQHIS